MHSGNVAVQELAVRLERTPSSVALKLVNFASLDPDHRRRGVRGMTNVSQLDRDLWDEYYGRWDVLADADESDTETESSGMSVSTNTESSAYVRTRRGQQFFRRTVLAAFGFRCCVTRIASTDLIRASHIIPWAAQDSTRLDPHNGLALNALHDAAFDKGLITFDDELRLLVSDQLRDTAGSPAYEHFFGRYAGAHIDLPERFAPLPDYLAYHRNNIFDE